MPPSDFDPTNARRRSFLLQTAAAGVLTAINATSATTDHITGSANGMKSYQFPQTDLVVSRIAYGCADLVTWDIRPLEREAIASADRVISTAYDSGITFFDLAENYAFSKTETVFGKVIKRSQIRRDKIAIQSKCGVRYFTRGPESSPSYDHYFDCSYKHIINSVEASLQRIGTDHLDILLLHFPDPLVEPAEVAKAFDELSSSGKVRYFGLSNHTVSQIDLLKKDVRQPLVVNQIHLGLSHSDVLADGLDGNLADNNRVTGIVDYCRLHRMSLQAYSPLRGLLNPPADAPLRARRTAQALAEIAAQKNTKPSAVALAWLMRHPAGIVPIIGTTNVDHIVENCLANSVNLSREEWQRLMILSGGATLQA
jgi:predicted oxidoreductase